MTEREKKLWGWAGKLLLVAIPAAISGYTSYKQSQVEAEAQGAAAYTALRTAFEGAQKNIDELTRHVYAQDGKIAVLEAMCIPPKVSTVAPLLPLVKPPASVDAGVDGDGIPDRPRPFKHKDSGNADLPLNYDDMVQKFRPKK